MVRIFSTKGTKLEEITEERFPLEMVIEVENITFNLELTSDRNFSVLLVQRMPEFKPNV
jgi:hypothetical protein